MSIFSRLLGKAQPKAINIDEAMKEAFRSGESTERLAKLQDSAEQVISGIP